MLKARPSISYLELVPGRGGGLLVSRSGTGKSVAPDCPIKLGPGIVVVVQRIDLVTFRLSQTDLGIAQFQLRRNSRLLGNARPVPHLADPETLSGLRDLDVRDGNLLPRLDQPNVSLLHVDLNLVGRLPAIQLGQGDPGALFFHPFAGKSAVVDRNRDPKPKYPLVDPGERIRVGRVFVLERKIE